MGTRSVTVALCISLLSAGAAGYCYTRADALQVQGQWLMERGTAQAEDYANRLDGTAADAQLKTFAERRTVLQRAHQWQRGTMLGVLAAVLAAVSAYMLFLLKRLDDQLVDAMGELRPSSSSPPAHSAPDHTPALASGAQR
ncbi:hypothetical protein [Pyxidicoccus xibeiensis]|uniref:hypothetical protein n=1 Tax=Pyxidicoccus xibeiensis TaxID=2906759 RepID=UPI0020A6E1E6|nr:hypothetical protein [Pyxidicoccus xibeiensis]MCP3142537.1 hypothetical protein [Pyxidicoccus xibeiensis]